MPHADTKKKYTFEEISEMTGLTVRQLQGLFYHHKKTFGDKHTTMIRLQDHMHITRVFMDLGVERLKFLGKKMMKMVEGMAAAKQAEESLEQLIIRHSPAPLHLEDCAMARCGGNEWSGLIPAPKDPDIEKVSKPKVTLPTDDLFEKDMKFMSGEKACNTGTDDEVLDIAVKIVAERQAFNKIKEEIVVLRHENTRMKSLLLEIGSLVGGL